MYIYILIYVCMYVYIHINIFIIKFKFKFMYLPIQFDLDGVHVRFSSTLFPRSLYNSTPALVMKETFRSSSGLKNISSQLSLIFSSQKRLSGGSRRILGLTMLTKTISSQFGVQNMINKSKFIEPQIITATVCLDFIGHTSVLIITVIIFSADTFL